MSDVHIFMLLPDKISIECVMGWVCDINSIVSANYWELSFDGNECKKKSEKIWIGLIKLRRRNVRL